MCTGRLCREAGEKKSAFQFIFKEIIVWLYLEFFLRRICLLKIELTQENDSRNTMALCVNTYGWILGPVESACLEPVRHEG